MKGESVFNEARYFGALSAMCDSRRCFDSHLTRLQLEARASSWHVVIKLEARGYQNVPPGCKWRARGSWELTTPANSLPPIQ